MDEEMPMFCRRCGRELVGGRGDFYVVRVEAVADPSPPVISGEELAAAGAGMEKLVEELGRYSEQELMDMVHRRLTFFLCRECYRGWIENPVG